MSRADEGGWQLGCQQGPVSGCSLARQGQGQVLTSWAAGPEPRVWEYQAPGAGGGHEGKWSESLAWDPLVGALGSS